MRFAFLIVLIYSLPCEATNPAKFLAKFKPTNSELLINRSQSVIAIDSIFRWTYYSGSWLDRNRVIFQNDWQGRVLSYVSENYTNSWKYSQRNIYSYDSNNNIASITTQSWNGSLWQDSTRESRIYDIQNRISQELIQNSNGSTWENLNQVFYYWRGNDLDSALLQEWNGASWVNSIFMESNYDANNILHYAIYYKWQSGWMLLQKDIFTFNSNGNLTVLLHQLWHSNMWNNHSKEQYYYNLNFLKEQTDFYLWIANSWGFPKSEYYTYDTNDMILSMTFKEIGVWDSTHYYYKDLTGISEQNLSDITISVLPNPITDNINLISTINLNKKIEITLTDVCGKVILRNFANKIIPNEIFSIDASSLKNGIYFLKLYNDNFSFVKKIIKN